MRWKERSWRIEKERRDKCDLNHRKKPWLASSSQAENLVGKFCSLNQGPQGKGEAHTQSQNISLSATHHYLPPALCNSQSPYSMKSHGSSQPTYAVSLPQNRITHHPTKREGENERRVVTGFLYSPCKKPLHCTQRIASIKARSVCANVK